MGGGKLLIISTHSHLQENICSFMEKGVLVVSNSLAWLLTEIGEELNANYYDYEADLCSIIYGEKKLKSTIPLRNGKTVRLHRNCNITVGEDLTLMEESKNCRPEFEDYKSYTDYLRKVLRAIADNATDNNRRRRFGMITTISQGYDATATSVLAKEIGCNEALTIRIPANDNGTEIALKLGYEVIRQIEPDAYKYNDKLLEAEAAATCSTAGIYEPYEQYCSGKLIFMGDRGDSVWDRGHANVNPNLDFHAGNGFSQASLFPSEHLLRINSVVVAVPLIAADAWPYIDKISSSEEMQCWSVANHYDRPIPRRIIETAGIERKSFGRQKAGAGISYHFNTYKSLKSKMSVESYKSLTQFMKYLKQKPFDKFKARIKFYASEAPVFLNYLLKKIRIPFRFNMKKTGSASSLITSLLFLWGIEEMKKRYKQ